MFDHMIPVFQEIFNEIRDILISPSNITQVEGQYYDNNNQAFDWDWQDFYKYFSMNGLHETDAFEQAITQNPNESYLYQIYAPRGAQFSKNCE